MFATIISIQPVPNRTGVFFKHSEIEITNDIYLIHFRIGKSTYFGFFSPSDNYSLMDLNRVSVEQPSIGVYNLHSDLTDFYGQCGDSVAIRAMLAYSAESLISCIDDLSDNETYIAITNWRNSAIHAVNFLGFSENEDLIKYIDNEDLETIKNYI